MLYTTEYVMLYTTEGIQTGIGASHRGESALFSVLLTSGSALRSDLFHIWYRVYPNDSTDFALYPAVPTDAFNFTFNCFPDFTCSSKGHIRVCVFLLTLKNLLCPKFRDYAISRVKPNPRQAFLLQVVKLT